MHYKHKEAKIWVPRACNIVVATYKVKTGSRIIRHFFENRLKEIDWDLWGYQ